MISLSTNRATFSVLHCAENTHLSRTIRSQPDFPPQFQMDSPSRVVAVARRAVPSGRGWWDGSLVGRAAGNAVPRDFQAHSRICNRTAQYARICTVLYGTICWLTG